MCAVSIFKTSVFLHVGIALTRTTTHTEMFLNDLTEKYDVEDAVFLADSTPGSH